MKIFKYQVPVDDRWHIIELRGRVVHVAATALGTVSLWAIHLDNNPPDRIPMRVIGTGHELDVPQGRVFVHLGTDLAEAPVGPPLVWHLIADVDPVDAMDYVRPGVSGPAPAQPPRVRTPPMPQIVGP